MNISRASGVLLHPTSLPGPHGIGALGLEAFRFVDFLAGAGQSVWQILPLGPTGYGDSPYSAFSAFAGNPLLICLERLAEAGDFEPEDLEGVAMPEGIAHFGFAHGFKGRLLHKAAQRFRRLADKERRERFEAFCASQSRWLDDYALFRSLRQHFGEKVWLAWPGEVRRREAAALQFWEDELQDLVHYHKFSQFIFFEQWFSLKEYATRRGVRIMGDLPIFVAFDSADVWANPHLFHLDDDFKPTVVSGVPPDYFSETGQRWGNPLYRWDRLREQGFAWWVERFRWALAQTDLVRIDHFRGFEACWSIPAEEPTAVNGEWRSVPGEELFRALAEVLGEVPVVAEDLGLITPEVEALRDRFGFPGMKVLQFAFDSGPDNPYLPHRFSPDCVAYTGTHDNDTLLGWWKTLDGKTRQAVRDYLGAETREPHLPWDLVRVAMASVSRLCIFPLQDLLWLDGQARMNRPGQSGGNWGWRYLPGAVTSDLQHRLARMTHTYGRAPKTL